MADSTVTLSCITDNAKTGWTRTGGASDHGALSDASDATYLTNNLIANPTNSMFLGITAHAFATTDQIKTVKFNLRSSSPDYQAVGGKLTDASTYVNLSNGTFSQFTSSSIQSTNQTLNVTGQPFADPTIWNAYNTGGILLEFHNSGGGGGDGSTNLYVYEASVTIGYNQAPSATFVSPSGTVGSLVPTLTMNYADPENDQMERFQVRIFSTAQYSIGGFDPASSPATFDSGEVFNNVVSSFNWTYRPTSPLITGTTYKAYVRVSDLGSSGRYGGWTASSTFTVSPSLPATPSMTATTDYPNQRIALTLSPGNRNLLSTNQASFESNLTTLVVAGTWPIAVNQVPGPPAYPITSSGNSKDGSYSMIMYSATAATMSTQTDAGVNGSPVLSNTAYEALASFATASGVGRNVNVGIKWWKADGSASTHPSDTGADIAEVGAGGFVQAVLSVTSPADAAFASVIVTVKSTTQFEFHYIDQVSLAQGSSTTWTPGGPLNAIIQKSEDNGLTWSVLKRPNVTSPATVTTAGVILIPNTVATVLGYDYESVRGNGTLYRAYVYVTDPTNGELDSPLSNIAGADLSITDLRLWNVKLPSNPSLNLLNVKIEHALGTATALQSRQMPFFDRSRSELAGWFSAIGRSKKIKIYDTVQGIEFPFVALCTTPAQYIAMKAIVDAQTTALIQSPTGEQWYVGFDLQVQYATLLPPDAPFYGGVEVTCIEVDTP